MTFQPRLTCPAFDESQVPVAIVLPVRNEIAHLATTLHCLLQQTFPSDRLEIIVVDGMSDDGTRELLATFQTECPYLRVIDNPRRVIPVALNLGIAASRAEVIVRVDARCRIDREYVARCVAHLARTGAANVGGPMRAEGNGMIAEAAVLAMRSRFGVGNSHHRYLEREEYVDTVYLGAFRREALDAVGWYDEELIRNQDDELNYRIRRAGYGVLLAPDIRSIYTPLGSLPGIWRKQFYTYGFWKVRVFQKHPGAVLPRHLAPPMLVATLLSSLTLSALARRRLFLLPSATYLATGLAAAVLTARRTPSRILPVAAVFGCMHLGYGSGFLHGLIDAAVRQCRSAGVERKSETLGRGAHE